MMAMLHCKDSRTDFSVSDGDQSGSNQSQSNKGGNNFITTVTNINQRQNCPLLSSPAIS